MLRTLEYGTIRVIEAETITRFDEFLRSDLIGEYDFYMLPDGEVVAVEIQKGEDMNGFYILDDFGIITEVETEKEAEMFIASNLDFSDMRIIRKENLMNPLLAQGIE